MRLNPLIGIAGASVLAALAIAAERTISREGPLTVELNRLKAQARAHDEAAAEHDRLANELAKKGDLAALEKQARQAGRLESQARRAQLELHNLQVKVDGGNPPPAVWPDGAAVWKAKDWTYAGKDTPADTLQSVLWAAREGNTEKLAGLIAFEPAARDNAQALFDQLPEASRAQYGSPEGVVATLIAGTMPQDYQAAAVVQSGTLTGAGSNAAITTLRVEQADGQESDLAFRTEKSADGWLLNVPANEIAVLQQRLQGTAKSGP